VKIDWPNNRLMRFKALYPNKYIRKPAKNGNELVLNELVINDRACE